MVGVGWSRGAVVLAALALTFCGGEPRRGPSGPVPDAGVPDAGVPDAGVPDAGVPDAGVPDAGVPDAGVPDAGVPDAGVPDAGVPDAGVPDAGDDHGGDDGSPDAGDDHGGDDALPDAGDSGDGTDDGSTELSCEGLNPEGEPGAPLILEIPALEAQDFNHYCIPGTSDGSGHLLIGVQNEFQPHETRLSFFDSSGTLLGTGGGVSLVPLAQANVFLGLNIYGANFDWQAVAVAGDGQLVKSTETFRSNFPRATTDPLGGIRVWNDTGTSPWTSSQGTLIAYDDGLAVRWQLSLEAPGRFAALGVDRAGNTLLLFKDGTELRGLWIGLDGTVDGGLFDAGAAPTEEEPMLAPRVGDGFFLGSVGSGVGYGPFYSHWLAQFSPDARHADPAPAWLTSHPDTALHMVHGGRGYALLPLQEASTLRCAQTVRIFAPSGASCGHETFLIDEDACRTAPLTVGYDGSVLQLNSPSRQTGCVGDRCPCTYRVWPGRFR